VSFPWGTPVQTFPTDRLVCLMGGGHGGATTLRKNHPGHTPWPPLSISLAPPSKKTEKSPIWGQKISNRAFRKSNVGGSKWQLPHFFPTQKKQLLFLHLFSPTICLAGLSHSQKVFPIGVSILDGPPCCAIFVLFRGFFPKGVCLDFFHLGRVFTFSIPGGHFSFNWHLGPKKRGNGGYPTLAGKQVFCGAPPPNPTLLRGRFAPPPRVGKKTLAVWGQNSKFRHSNSGKCFHLCHRFFCFDLLLTPLAKGPKRTGFARDSHLFLFREPQTKAFVRLKKP